MECLIPKVSYKARNYLIISARVIAINHVFASVAQKWMH